MAAFCNGRKAIVAHDVCEPNIQRIDEVSTLQDYTEQLIDFIYVDKPKVASFLAQFLSDGLIIEQSVSSTAAKNKSGKLTTTGKIASLLGVSASINGEASKSSAHSTTETVSKNPEWAQAKALVQYVADAHQQTQLEDSVGSLRVVEGQLQIFDLTPFRQIADNPRLIDSITAALLTFAPEKFSDELRDINDQLSQLDNKTPSKSNHSNSVQLKKELQGKKEEAERKVKILLNAMIEGISHAVRHSPFSTIGIIESHGAKYWFSLKQEFLLQDQGDTVLKYGYALEGTWAVAAILDGRPSNGANSQPDQGLTQIPWAAIARPFAEAGRTTLGRPNDFHSLMPLVVFRTLGHILR